MKTYNNIDLQFNQLLSAIAEKVEVLPEPTTLTEKQSWAGRIAYSTTVKKFHYYKYVNETDSKWVAINDLTETLDTIGDSTLTISEEDKIITKDSNGYGFKTIGDILQFILDNQQDTIESERLEYYRKDIGTDTEGIVYQKEHNLSNYFPIKFTFKYTDSEGWEQEVLIDHQRNMATNDFKWSIVTPYSADNLARIILVGYKGKVTETERDLMERYAYGIQWQATALGTASPTRIGNLDLHASLPIQSGMKGCIWNRTDGIKYYLDENDWSKKADGNASVLTGEDGDIMVRVPKFYGRCVVDGTTREVWISQYKISSAWIEIPEMVIAAYKGILIDDKWRSIIALNNYGNGSADGSQPQSTANETHWTKSSLGQSKSNISRANMRIACRNNGTELLCYEYYKWIMYWLPVIEYNCFNSQANAVVNSDGTPLLDANGYHQGMFGPGITNVNSTNWTHYKNGYYSMIPLGFGISNILSTRETLPVPSTYDNWHKGNTTWIRNITNVTLLNSMSGTVAGTNTIISYRGIFQPFGEIWQNLDGIVCRSTNVFTTTDPSKYANLDAHDSTAYNWVTSGGLALAGNRLNSAGYGTVHYSNETNQNIELFPSALGNADIGPNGTYGTYDYYNVANSSNRDYTVFVGGLAYYGVGAGLAAFFSYYGVAYASAAVGGRAYQLL